MTERQRGWKIARRAATDRGIAPRPEFVFVLEQALGHVVHTVNIERVLAGDPDTRAEVIRVEPGSALVPQLSSLRNWSLEASWATRTALRKRLAERPADALFIHTQVAALLAGPAMRAVPTIVSLDATPINFDSLGEAYGHGRQAAPVEWIKWRVNRRALDSSRAVVTWSQWAADSVVRDYRVADNKVHVIRPGVDLSSFRPVPAASRDEAVRVLFVGGDFTRKGGDDLIEAVQRLGPSVELDIVTSAAPASIPPGIAARVHVGLRANSDVLLGLYRNADIFALPTRGDCLPLAIAEALASGLPIVASRVGAIPEMVVDGHNGLLVPPASASDLADALSVLVHRPDLRRTMGDRSLRIAQRDHDVDRNCHQIFELMRRISGTGPEDPQGDSWLRPTGTSPC